MTGGAGFVGSHLVDRLINEKPANIVIVDNFFLGKQRNLQHAKDNFPIKVYNQNASDYDAMKEIIQNESIDVVFNLAVIPLLSSHVNPVDDWNVNVNIVLVLCELIRKNKISTLIHFSSSEAYGSAKKIVMDESHPLHPTTPYAASKAAADLLVLSYCETFGIDASIVRPFNNYGPRQNEGSYAGVVPITIKRIMGGMPPIIYGDGEQTRDYLYVTDTADAAIDIYNYKNTRSKIINIATGQEITIKKIITTIAEIMEFDEPIIYEKTRLADVRRHRGDISLAEKLIGFKTKVSFEEGIRQTVKWYKENITI